MCQNTCIVGNYDIYVFFNGWQKIMNRISNEHEWIYLTNESYAAVNWNGCVFLLLYQVSCAVYTPHNRKLITLIVNIHCGIRIKSNFFWFLVILIFFSFQLSGNVETIDLSWFTCVRTYNILIDCHWVWVTADQHAKCVEITKSAMIIENLTTKWKWKICYLH